VNSVIQWQMSHLVHNEWLCYFRCMTRVRKNGKCNTLMNALDCIYQTGQNFSSAPVKTTHFVYRHVSDICTLEWWNMWLHKAFLWLSVVYVLKGHKLTLLWHCSFGDRKGFSFKGNLASAIHKSSIMEDLRGTQPNREWPPVK